MSLLIDALRKAEQTRLENELQGPTAAEVNGALSLAPLEPGVPAEPPAPAALEPAATSAAAAERRTERLPPSASGVAPRSAARKLFEAKQAPPRRLFLPLVAGFTTLAVVVLGTYLWWELQPRGIVTANPTGSGTPPTEPRPAAAPVPPVGESGPPSAPTAAQVAAAGESRAFPRREPPPNRGSFAPPPPENPATSGLGPIRRGSPEADVVPAALANAYAAYNIGDLPRAISLYGEVLRQDAHNRDALDGLGAIALRQGKEGEAETWFRRSLAADPSDPVAQAGLTALRARGQPEQGESRMKSLVAAQPQAAPGHFALGNALAAQDRWPEAQQAYFEAHTLDPDNPDYLFNLAVSLDRLHQPALAGRFYAEALAAAGKRTASFDRNAAEARLQALAEAR
jgi:Flp pilus assembly protein TadD